MTRGGHAEGRATARVRPPTAVIGLVGGTGVERA